MSNVNAAAANKKSEKPGRRNDLTVLVVFLRQMTIPAKHTSRSSPVAMAVSWALRSWDSRSCTRRSQDGSQSPRFLKR